MKTLTWQKPGQQNVAQDLIKIIINYVAELRLTFNKDNTYTEKGENDTQNDTFEYFPNRYMFVTYYTTDWGEENTIYTVVKITKDELYLNNNENFKINWNDLINGHVGCKLYSM